MKSNSADHSLIPPRTFASVASGRDNNFDFLRYLFASLVIFAHSFAFIHGDTYDGYDPLCHITRGQLALGGLAVHGFFLISGFLIARSWLAARSWRDYAWRRFLRIVPALAVVLAFCVFVVGPLATSDLAAYVRNPHSYRFLALMFETRIKSANVLPGVFTSNPWPNDVNGSLWTIRYECLCYVMVAVFGALGILRKRFALLLLTGLLFSAAMFRACRHVPDGQLDHALMLTTYFLTGTLFLLYQDVIPRRGWIAALALVASAIFAAAGVLPMVEPVLFAYMLFYVAFWERIPLQQFAKRGDLSYGVYLYAFPVQQLLVLYFGRYLNPYSLAAVALLLVSGIAAMSWRFVERPSMRLKRIGTGAAPRIREHRELNSDSLANNPQLVVAAFETP